MTRSVKVGQYVVFVDEDRVAHDALITTIWGDPMWDDEKPYVSDYSKPESKNWPPGLNIVYVLEDISRTDQYGQQTRHATSVVHEVVSGGVMGGYIWRLPA